MPVSGDSTSDSSCVYIPQWDGMPVDQLAATIANIGIAVIGILSLLYYGAHAYFATCGWEEVYVCLIELIKVFLEIFLEYCVPVTFNETNGNHVVWIRYAEWLLTCPVILIHLSNLTGLADDYNKRTMSLLVSDIGTIVMGVTAAIASGYVKVAFFLLGLCYGCVTFKLAGQIHLEAYYAMPKGPCRRLVLWMAVVFFTSWLGYPVLFMLGSEGFFGKLSPWASVLGHCIVDVLSKNVWGFLGHHLRIHVQEHIVMYGIVRVRKTHKFLGLFELEVETLVESEEIKGAVRSSVPGMAHMKSLHKVRSNLIAKGHSCPELELPASTAGSPTGRTPHARTPMDFGLSSSGDTEFILPSQFLLGNPRWHSSAAGSFQRIHPAVDSDAGRLKPRSSRSRGVSLDWPGRIPGAPQPTVQAGASGDGSAAGAVEARGDAVAAVNVRAKATVGPDGPK